MNKVPVVALVSIAFIFSFASYVEAQKETGQLPAPVIIQDPAKAPSIPNTLPPSKNSSQKTLNSEQTPTQRGFAKSNTKMNTTEKNEIDDNGYVASFVTGTKVPIDMGRLGAGISVITADMIQEMKPASIADILRIAPGVIINERGANYITASIQGAPAGETNVMIDGISLLSPADPNHAVDLSLINLNMDSIDRIEIIKNPASIGTGYGASGGIINIITKNGEEQDYTASLYGEMLFDLENKLNGYKTGLNFAGSKETFKYGLSYNRTEEIGISSAAKWYGNGEKDGNGSNNAVINFTIMPIEGLSSGIYINYTDFYKEYDNHGGKNGDNTDYKMTMENVSFGWHISYKVKDVWEPSLKLTYKYINKKYNNKDSNSPVLMGNGKYNGQQVALDFNNNFYIVKQFRLSVGAEYLYDAADIRENDSGVEKRLKNKTVDGVNTYIQATVDLFDAWTTVVSARGNVYGDYGYIPTYGVSTAYNIEQAGLTIKASFGTGLLTPTIYQQYDPEFGTPCLKPEESMSYQAGFTNDILDGIVIWGGSWFENYYKNMITKKDGARYENIGKAHTYGVEASVRANPLEFMSIYGSYTWLNAFSTENGAKTKIDYMPEHSVFGGVIFKTKEVFLLNLNVNYVSDKFGTPDYIVPATKTVLKQYYLLNASMAINFTKNFQLYITGTNLMDTRYESTDGYGTRGLEIAVGLKAKI